MWPWTLGGVRSIYSSFYGLGYIWIPLKGTSIKLDTWCRFICSVQNYINLTNQTMNFQETSTDTFNFYELLQNFTKWHDIKFEWGYLIGNFWSSKNMKPLQTALYQLGHLPTTGGGGPCSLGTKPYYSISQVPSIWPLSQYKRPSELDTQARDHGPLVNSPLFMIIHEWLWNLVKYKFLINRAGWGWASKSYHYRILWDTLGGWGEGV